MFVFGVHSIHMPLTNLDDNYADFVRSYNCSDFQDCKVPSTELIRPCLNEHFSEIHSNSLANNSAISYFQ
jgi:hypothetical protein